jgi:hypothetical protein
MDVVMNVLIGMGLAATCGFRVFVPFLVLGIAGLGGYLPLRPGFQWIASYPALIVFGVATLLEVLAYFFPWVDNILATVSVPVSAIAGVVLTAAVMTDVSPVLQWALAIIAGGGAATASGVLSSGVHHSSTLVSAGTVNPVISALESVGTVLIAIMAIVAPILAILLIILAFLALYRIFHRVRRRLGF